MGVRGEGGTLAEAYEQAALALTAVIAEPGTIRPHASVHIECDAPDEELLFVDWLNALIYEMATRHMLFSRFDLHLEGSHLSARVWGEPVDAERHQPAVEVKGASYTALKVGQEEDGHWYAQCVVDV